MPPPALLPRSELEIARIVGELGRATVRQVAEALPRERKLDFWTVQTYLRRLTDKGYLRVRREGRANVYMPRIAPQRMFARVVGDLVQRAFGGKALPLFQHLIREEALTDEEIDQLQKELDRLKERRK